jgi:hypothetical protein
MDVHSVLLISHEGGSHIGTRYLAYGRGWMHQNAGMICYGIDGLTGYVLDSRRIGSKWRDGLYNNAVGYNNMQ